MKVYDRIFGIGPVGLIISLGLLALAFKVKDIFQDWILFNTIIPRIIILFTSSCAAIAIIFWSIQSLPPQDRGKCVCNKGAFRFLRHPLYAAFLTIFNVGFALYLNNVIFIVWAILLHPLWHILVRLEEKLMINEFREEYIKYAKNTGRFIPKILNKSG